MLVSETFSIQDCYFNGRNTSAFIIPSNTTFSDNGEYVTASTSISGEKLVYLNKIFSNSDEFEFEIELAKIGTEQSVAMCWYDGHHYGGTNQNSSNRYFYSSGMVTSNIYPQIGDKFTVRRKDGKITVYVNGVSIGSYNAPTSLDSYKIGFYLNRSRIQYYKNIKVKPL